MMISRKTFISSVFAFLLAFKNNALGELKHKSFKDALSEEMKETLKRHLLDDNEHVHRLIEAELNDWAHMHLMSGELDMFKVQCSSNDNKRLVCWLHCMFKEHDNENIYFISMSVTNENN